MILRGLAKRSNALRSLSKGSLMGMAIAGLLFCAPSCGNSEASASVSTGAGDSNGPSQSLNGLVYMLQQAPETIPYEGIRRVDRYSEVPAVSYRELVAGDGAGGYQLDVQEVISANLDVDTFREEMAQTKGFQYRYGGFRIRDGHLFQKNYKISILSRSEFVAGIECMRLHVESQDPTLVNRLSIDSPNHFLVDFDPETGLVLRWQEIDAFGATVTQVAFESLSYGEPSVAMHEPAFTETPLSIEQDLSAQAGFHVLRPTLLPKHFELQSASLVTADSDVWVRQVFSDGLESMLLMHKAKTPSKDATASTIGALSTGDRTVVMGVVNNYEVIAEGKFDLDNIQDFLSSAF